MLTKSAEKPKDIEVEARKDLLQCAIQIAGLLPRTEAEALAILDYAREVAAEFFEASRD